MNQQPITTAEYNALPDEEKELYGPEVQRYWADDEWHICLKDDFWQAISKNDSIKKELVHYPKPEASQQPTQQNAPLINEGGETVESFLDRNTLEAWELSNRAQVVQIHIAKDAVTTLQTALAEANNKIAELESKLAIAIKSNRKEH